MDAQKIYEYLSREGKEFPEPSDTDPRYVWVEGEQFFLSEATDLWEDAEGNAEKILRLLAEEIAMLATYVPQEREVVNKHMQGRIASAKRFVEGME